MVYKRKDNKIIFRLDKGEEILDSIKQICKKENVKCGSISGIGATDKCSIGVYLLKSKEYKVKNICGDHEIVSCNGNVSMMNGEVYLHLHIALIDETNYMLGGHLSSCYISATFEGIIDIIPLDVTRIKDDKSGLNLLKID